MTKLKRGIKSLFLMFCLCACFQSVCAASLKITDIFFDSSDNLILFQTQGTLTSLNEESAFKNLALEGGNLVVSKENAQPVRNPIRKGVLANPARAYFDIDNAILIGSSKTWKVENSDIVELRISQYTIAPEIVRITAVLKEGKNPDNIEIYRYFNQLVLKYNSNISQNDYFQPIYKNYPENIEKKPKIKASLITSAQEPTKELQITPEIQNKTDSDFFLNFVNKAGKGLVLQGIGRISIKRIIKLENPTRLVVDLENAVLSDNLKNKSYIIEPVSNVMVNVISSQIGARDLLRVGQFDTDTVRIVIQGMGAKDYRLVTSPDLQNLFIAKRWDIINSTICDINAKILSLEATSQGSERDLFKINFDNPIAYSIFEEGGYLHLDIQNTSLPAPQLLSPVLKRPDFKTAKTVRLATDKTRFSFPSSNKEITAKISQDSKNLQIYFKKPTSIVQKPKTEKKVVVDSSFKVKMKPAIISNHYKVVIDPGHGGSDTGAIREGVSEKAINQAIASLVRENLLKKKVDVLTTMPFDKTVPLAERVDFANEANPDLFVSIHANSSMKPDIKGIEIHWWRDASIPLARAVKDKLSNEKTAKKWNTIDRGLFKSQFYVINHTTMPAILIEVGFMSNPEELKNLKNPKRQQETADAISDGIMDYLKKRGK